MNVKGKMNNSSKEMPPINSAFLNKRRPPTTSGSNSSTRERYANDNLRPGDSVGGGDTLIPGWQESGTEDAEYLEYPRGPPSPPGVIREQ